MTAPSWADLESKGYVVVRSWASPDEVTRLREDFEAQPLDGNKNYTLKLLGPGIIEWLTGKLHDTASQVRSHTDIRADMLAFPPPVYFAIDLGTNFPWHQDHESFFLLQEHYHYLNFYLAVVKPRPDKSNLAVIPFDRLQKLSPTFHDRVKGGGASHIMNWIEGQPALFVDDQTGQTTVLSFDPEQAAAIPELEAGDLLIIRGDMFHRTQDVETHRISASFRMADSHGTVQRWKLAHLTMLKLLMLLNNHELYQDLLEAYEHAGRGELSVGDYLAALTELRARKKRRVSRLKFRQTLSRALLAHPDHSGPMLAALGSEISSGLPKLRALYSPRAELDGALGDLCRHYEAAVKNLQAFARATEPLSHRRLMTAVGKAEKVLAETEAFVTTHDKGQHPMVVISDCFSSSAASA